MEKGVREKGVRKNANKKNLGPRNRIKRGVYAEKGESILTLKRGEGGGTNIRGRSAEEGVHPTLQVAPNVTSTFHGKKGWHTEDGARLSTHKSVDGKKRIPPLPHRGHTGQSRKEEGVYEAGLEMGI